MKNKQNLKPKKKVSNIVLFFVCVMIVLYTAAAFVLQYCTNLEVSSTMTTCWFAFWGSELIALATIKCTKVRKNSESPADEDEEYDSDYDNEEFNG